MFSKKFYREAVTLTLLFTGISALGMGCTKKTAEAPIAAPAPVSEFQVNPVGKKPGILDSSGDLSVDVKITFKKAEIFSREFLYGADIQYSDNYNKTYDLYNQTIAIGHIPVKFRLIGTELQLVRERTNKFPSEVNKPEMLISRFKVLSETENSVTVSRMNSDQTLAEAFLQASDDTIPGEILNKKAALPRDSWVRSFNYVPEGAYLLQETSLKTSAGDVIEFMESIFPRENLKASEEFNALKMDASDPVGFSEDDILHRFRFLKGETLTQPETSAGESESKYSFAQKFDLGAGPIEWWVTRNAPDDMLPHIREGIDGWNRYFLKMEGIEKNVVKFMGRLPENVKIGDPRYNVVSWDSRRVAGAAYESQASDPETGRQSHSLVYMPAAWIQIGETYWKAGEFTDTEAGASSRSHTAASATATDPTVTDMSGPKAGRKGVLNRGGVARCARDLRDRAQELDLSAMPVDAVKKFGIQLMKQTLFHEIGHALGLGHNFKGSLSHVMGDFSKPTASIMDYNSFEEERSAFNDVNSEDGPLLEYDFQALSALYNGAADLSDESKHPVLPACNDEEADAEEEGVDPLCTRYDVDTDPGKSIQKAFDRLDGKTVEFLTSAPDAVKKIRDLNLTDEKKSAMKSLDEVKSAATKIRNSLLGTLRFHIHQGRGSVGRTVRINLRALKVMKEGALDEGKASTFRTEVLTGMEKLIGMKELPTATREAVLTLEKDALAFLSESAPVKGLSDEEKAKALENLKDRLNVVETFEKKDATGLQRGRSALVGALGNTKAAFFFDEVGGITLDIEKVVTDAVKSVALNEGGFRGNAERLVSISTLKTYKGRLFGDIALDAVEAGLKKERADAKSNKDREFIQSLLDALKEEEKE